MTAAPAIQTQAANGAVGEPPPPAGRARVGITGRIALLALLTTALSTGLVAWLGYRMETRAAMRGLDARLRAMSAAIPEVIGPGYHERARAGRVSDEEFMALLERLSGLAGQAGVVYLYTCVQDGGRVLFTSTNATAEERAAGDWSHLLQPYEEPPAELLAAFADGEARFAEYTDEYGSFRSIFAIAGEGADRFAVGVDVGLSDLRAIARANLLWFAGVGGAVGLGVSLVGVAVGRRIARPIVGLARDIREYGEGGLDAGGGGDADPPTLRRLVDTDRTETGDLARAFSAMRRRLAERVRDLVRVTTEKERITSQLDVARKIQRSLLPSVPPRIEGYDIAGWSEPADQTGGDYYDWSVTPDGQVIVSIADVTGHGIGPAIMASVCRAYARATLGDRQPLAPLLERLNRLVHADTRGMQFVTFFAGVLNPAARTMLVISAGHGPVLFYRAADGSVTEVATHGIPLGITDEMGYEAGSEIEFAPGDVLFLVSDGFFEWMSAHKEQFGTSRLSEALAAAAAAGLPSEGIIESVRGRVEEFTAGTEQPDDMTAVVIKCVG